MTIRLVAPHDDITPEDLRKLGALILVRALRDAVSGLKDDGSRAARDEAREWLTTPSDDLHIVCEWVELNPDTVRKRSALLIDSGLRFSGKGHKGHGWEVGDIQPLFSCMDREKEKRHVCHRESGAFAPLAFAGSGAFGGFHHAGAGY